MTPACTMLERMPYGPSSTAIARETDSSATFAVSNPGAGAAGLPAEVSATAAAADLTLDVRDLAAAYLGGRSLAALARAGLVTEHRPGALRGASAAFGWPLAPLCSWAF